MARKLPDPSERSEKEPAVLCSSERILNLYNNYNKSKPAQRVSKDVRGWFTRTAQEEGWDAAFFLKDVETKHSAGCVLYKKPTNILVNLFISDGDDES
jgi:hypothetical protein